MQEFIHYDRWNQGRVTYADKIYSLHKDEIYSLLHDEIYSLPNDGSMPNYHPKLQIMMEDPPKNYFQRG